MVDWWMMMMMMVTTYTLAECNACLQVAVESQSGSFEVEEREREGSTSNGSIRAKEDVVGQSSVTGLST